MTTYILGGLSGLRELQPRRPEKWFGRLACAAGLHEVADVSDPQDPHFYWVCRRCGERGIRRACGEYSPARLNWLVGGTWDPAVTWRDTGAVEAGISDAAIEAGGEAIWEVYRQHAGARADWAVLSWDELRTRAAQHPGYLAWELHDLARREAAAAIAAGLPFILRPDIRPAMGICRNPINHELRG